MDNRIPIGLDADTITIDFTPTEILINPPVRAPRSDEPMPKREGGPFVSAGTWECATDDTAPIGGSFSYTVYYDRPTGAIISIVPDDES